MLTERFSDETLYQALLDRDAGYDGFAYVCVTSTRIFCRFTCPARKPRRENCRFRTTIAECLNEGFRPCKRCTPMLRYGAGDPVVTTLLEALEADPGTRWSQERLISLGHDPSTVRRAFKRRFGMSFLDLARQRRLGQAVTSLEAGSPVIEAQLDAGFDSGSGFRNAINQLIGTSPMGVKNQSLLKADWLDTPIGPMLAVTCGNALHLLEFADRPALPAGLKRLQARLRSGIPMGRTSVTEQLQAELAAYFKGTLSAFSIRIGDHGTPFERSVWSRLQEIPAGTSQSYSAIAQDLQRPTAVRAVARANGANQIAIIIPCHRVIGADGSLTGYGGGLWRKQWLLRHEQRSFTSPC
ncbi:bifunctional transcriptional activator/DNA repair enzyme AdaA [Rhizobium oryzicola]|uniref:Trifunctional transcriptional activator/DNA repair protein Ada/methylated-DNA--[protein]-cysteine S-methyltransferase n=1 Tax=Rhizobium oryzicola TaxID=1232668 RepID=A0ABT8ST88_9HYPH|nr:trifunctional transcriptional activator/DNA repair protein Ada/methylated-DNA--[protein]-cysteine S-methyltransferase [Rhizobium oryzicola]MDO1581622.1 trifunctional transcriptional activator/DNA repair protein Ada/methylated-DNA--[protein]-cysteine S-methyltransferase [Rhizobium oryzicola]